MYIFGSRVSKHGEDSTKLTSPAIDVTNAVLPRAVEGLCRDDHRVLLVEQGVVRTLGEDRRVDPLHGRSADARETELEVAVREPPVYVAPVLELRPVQEVGDETPSAGDVGPVHVQDVGWSKRFAVPAGRRREGVFDVQCKSRARRQLQAPPAQLAVGRLLDVRLGPQRQMAANELGLQRRIHAFFRGGGVGGVARETAVRKAYYTKGR